MNLFDKIEIKIKYIDEEAELYFDVLNIVKEIEVLINKLKVRYKRYEQALTTYANSDNWYKYEFCNNPNDEDGSILAKEALLTEEEIHKQEVSRLKLFLSDFDKKVIDEVLKELS